MLIKNGTIATHNGLRKADLLVQKGAIAKISGHITPSGREETINAQGLTILPGLVDCHVHLRDPGATQKEDFFTGMSSAIAGGVTTIIDMPNNAPPTTSMQALQQKKQIASKRAACDYAFHFGATLENAFESKRACADPSVAGLKIFFGSSTGNLLVNQAPAVIEHLKCAKPACFHAEDEEAVQYKSHAYKSKFPKGKAEFHNRIRSPLEAECAVAEVLSIARQAKKRVHICHVSTRGELKQLAAFKRAGTIATCEATPHHLFLSEENLQALGNFGKVNPPLRSKKDQAALWNAVANGTIDCIASDHAPHLREEKERNYWDAPSGVPGVETALPLMLSALPQKRLSLARLIQLSCTNPAKIFSLKSKGEIAVGKDADLVLVDLKKKHKISADNLHSKCGWTPYEGFAATGKVEKTILRGKLAFDGENVLISQGEGKPAKTA